MPRTPVHRKVYPRSKAGKEREAKDIWDKDVRELGSSRVSRAVDAYLEETDPIDDPFFTDMDQGHRD